MTTINYSISVHQCSKGIVRVVGICNGKQCSTCLTLENGDCIEIYNKDLDRDIVPVYTNGHDYIVRINKEAA